MGKLARQPVHRPTNSSHKTGKRVTIAVKGLDKDTMCALKRSYGPLFYDLMRVLDARKYKKATHRNPALIGDAREDLLKTLNGREFGVTFEISDIQYDSWSHKPH
ncbi:MAG: hypothetical protein JSV60_08880 [Desulfobacterales bacterium]|nr:MAG: hypothetical protein JSV60_08880 [Desulfobacterales bacterium]